MPKPRIKKNLFKGKQGLNKLHVLFRHVCLSQAVDPYPQFCHFHPQQSFSDGHLKLEDKSHQFLNQGISSSSCVSYQEVFQTMGVVHEVAFQHMVITLVQMSMKLKASRWCFY